MARRSIVPGWGPAGMGWDSLGGAPGMGMGTPLPTLLPSEGGKAASSPREEGFSVGSRSLRSDADSEEKQRAFGGAGIYFV